MVYDKYHERFDNPFAVNRSKSFGLEVRITEGDYFWRLDDRIVGNDEFHWKASIQDSSVEQRSNQWLEETEMMMTSVNHDKRPINKVFDKYGDLVITSTEPPRISTLGEEIPNEGDYVEGRWCRILLYLYSDNEGYINARVNEIIFRSPPLTQFEQDQLDKAKNPPNYSPEKLALIEMGAQF